MECSWSLASSENAGAGIKNKTVKQRISQWADKTDRQHPVGGIMVYFMIRPQSGNKAPTPFLYKFFGPFNKEKP
jgi:hypothetical protein